MNKPTEPSPEVKQEGACDCTGHCDFCFTVKPCVIEDDSGRMMCQDCLDKRTPRPSPEVAPMQRKKDDLAGMERLRKQSEGARRQLEAEGVCPSCGRANYAKDGHYDGCPRFVPAVAPRETQMEPLCENCGKTYSEAHWPTGRCGNTTAFWKPAAQPAKGHSTPYDSSSELAHSVEELLAENQALRERIGRDEERIEVLEAALREATTLLRRLYEHDTIECAKEVEQWLALAAPPGTPSVHNPIGGETTLKP